MSGAEWLFYIETYGCKVNQYESQAIRERWLELGGRPSAAPGGADYILINSCAITSRGERDARNAVYRLKREAPGARIILSGCAAQFFAGFQPRKKANWAAPDICVPQKDKKILLNGPWLEYGEQAFPPVDFSISGYNRGRPVLKIQDGCSQNCSYCIVPQTRGGPISRPPLEILAEARRLFSAGYGELMISGVNLRQYGKDRPEFGDFWELMSFLDGELAPDFANKARLRLSSLEPCQLSPEGLEKLFNLKLVCPHIHISLQHASREVLRRMGRGHYSRESVLESIGALSGHWPVFGLGADIIAGFPGETEDDLRVLLDFIEESPLTYAHVFPFSARQGTAAMRFSGQIILREKKARADRIRQKVLEKKKAFLRGQLKMPSMLVAPDLPGKNAASRICGGVNEYYVPCLFEGKGALAAPSGLLAARPEFLENGQLKVSLFAGARRKHP